MTKTLISPEVDGGMAGRLGGVDFDGLLRALDDTKRYAEAELSKTRERREELRDRLVDLSNSLAATEEISKTGSFRWNLVTSKDHWSDGFYRLLGKDPLVDNSTTEDFISCLHPEDRSRVLSTINNAAETKTPFEFEFRLLLSDGRVRYVRSRGRPDGSEHFIGVLMDVSEHREAEQELRRTDLALSRASQQAMMGELAASIAHDLNQPLTSIAANAGAATRWLNRATPDIAKVQESLRALIRDSKRAGSILHGMQGLAARTEIDASLIPVDAMISEVLEGSDAAVRLQNAVVIRDLDTGSAMIPGDKVQIQQVLYNLIINGLEAMGGVADRPRQLVVSSRQVDDGFVELTVTDNGCGISGVVADRLFESFYTTKQSGMGLGLAICRSIVDRHRGSIAVSPQEPFGTSFCVRLPLRASHP